MEPGECLSSDDVSALFTSVPIDPALKVIKDLLDKDTTLKERTVMEVGDIILLLEFCLKNTYFSFQGQFYKQVEGAAMGSPVSPIVANLYMEYLEQKALSTAPHPPTFWGRYVDDTFVIHKEVNKQGFLQHINSVDPAIRFTVEDNKEDGSIPFLDTIVCYVGQYMVKSSKFSLSSFNWSCLGVNYCIYSVYCNTQLLVFRFSFLRIT